MTAVALLCFAAAVVFLVISIREHAARVRMQAQVEDIARYHNVRAELAAAQRALEETRRALDVYEVGLYANHYDVGDADEYRRRLDQERERQKRMVKEDAALRTPKGWTVGGSAKEGETLIRQQAKMMLRAFNGECDVAVAQVRWDNATAMEERIRRGYAAINKADGVTRIEVAVDYLESKLAELRLAHEHAEKVQEEREEQRRIKGQMREEERARKELEKAQEEAEQEERRYERALDKAKEELERSSGAAQAALEEKVRALELQLAEVHTQKERAISRAQQTRSGPRARPAVARGGPGAQPPRKQRASRPRLLWSRRLRRSRDADVISNIGSFGEVVFKIGMTRRLDPPDRVKEFGDASVPFEFDVHAMV